MRTVFMRGVVLLSLLPAPALFAGCSGSQDSKKPAGDKAQKEDQKDKDAKQVGKDKDDDSSEDGWWCNAHGIPEDECSMCSGKVEKECKAKGDWCEKHNRAKSQCFICEPKLKEQYAARYRAKYGKEPPPIKE
jgi:hypothetical protein